MINRPIRKARQRGFTLIEAMIVVVIVAILAAIAYPSYLEQIRKANRSVAKSGLLEVANKQMHYFFSERGYGAISQLYNVAFGNTAIYFDKSGVGSFSAAGAVYAVSVTETNNSTCGGAPCFTLEAAPQGDQASDACGTFILTSNNKRDVSNSSSTPASKCW